MPKGTKVEKQYNALRYRRHFSKASAARIAQSDTGQSLLTGKPIAGGKKKMGKKKQGQKRHGRRY